MEGIDLTALYTKQKQQRQQQQQQPQPQQQQVMNGIACSNNEAIEKVNIKTYFLSAIFLLKTLQLKSQTNNFQQAIIIILAFS